MNFRRVGIEPPCARSMDDRRTDLPLRGRRRLLHPSSSVGVSRRLPVAITRMLWCAAAERASRPCSMLHVESDDHCRQGENFSHDRTSVADHRGGQLPTAGLAGGSCAARDHGAARARPRAVAGAGAVSGAGAGRRHAAGDPRHGARRHRHHHRRRDAPRELLQPLRHRARRHRQRQPRDHHQPGRALGQRAARGRQGAAQAAGRGRRHEVSAPQHRAQGQDHAARPVHHGAAGQERVLQGRRRDGDGLRRRGERGGARPRRPPAPT